MDERDELILMEFKGIGKEVGAFLSGILSNDLSPEDQRLFALRLVRLAEHIKDRADQSVGMVVEGNTDDDDGRRMLGAGAATTEPEAGELD